MALILADGFEGGFAATGGWTPGSLAYLDTSPRQSPSGFGGSYCVGSQIRTALRFFPLNNDTGLPLQIREIYSSFGVRSAGDDFFNQVGFARDGTRSAALSTYPVAGRVLAIRDGTFLGDAAAPMAPNQWKTWRVRTFADSVNGEVEVRRANSDAPVLSLTGVVTVLAGGNWFNQALLRTQSVFPRYDDLVIQAPTIRLAGIAGPRPPMDTLLTGGTSGATVLVSEAEFARNRVWVHSWNGTPFINGETISGGGFSATVVAPGANFVDGFEPNSFWTRGVPFVLAGAPTADGAVALTPTPGAPNVGNINDIPENTTQFNSALSGLPEQDTYTGIPALPPWVIGVYGVCPDAYAGQDSSSYVDMRVTVADPTGSAVVSLPLASSGDRNFYSFDTRSDGSSWSPSDIPLLSLTYLMDV